jgi:ribonucleotide monophosphatase NagD (HAD superfamily)
LGPRRTSAKHKQVVEVITTNPDLLYADDWSQPRYGPKAIEIMFTSVFKAHYGFDMQVTPLGKPLKPTYDYIEKRLVAKAQRDGVKISNFYMIGDNPKSDIAGAITKGWTSILVKTGVFDPRASTSTKDGNDKEFPATYSVKDFEEAINLIYKLENLE